MGCLLPTVAVCVVVFHIALRVVSVAFCVDIGTSVDVGIGTSVDVGIGTSVDVGIGTSGYGSRHAMGVEFS